MPVNPTSGYFQLAPTRNSALAEFRSGSADSDVGASRNIGLATKRGLAINPQRQLAATLKVGAPM